MGTGLMPGPWTKPGHGLKPGPGPSPARLSRAGLYGANDNKRNGAQYRGGWGIVLILIYLHNPPTLVLGVDDPTHSSS